MTKPVEVFSLGVYYFSKETKMKIYTINKAAVQYQNRRKMPSPLSFSGKPRLKNLDNFFEWIDRNNSFYFQILGIAILTAGMLLSFQVFPQSASSTAYASDNEEPKVHLFQIYNDFDNDDKLEEIYIEPDVSLIDAETASLEEVTEQKLYKVKNGDTLYAIAKKLKTNSENLKELNNLQYPYTLSIGQELIYFES